MSNLVGISINPVSMIPEHVDMFLSSFFRRRTTALRRSHHLLSSDHSIASATQQPVMAV
jgi:hypothetical protein